MLQEHHILFRRLHLGADLVIAVGSYLLGRLVMGDVTTAQALREPALLILTVALFITLGSDPKPYKIRLRSQGVLLRVASLRWLLALASTLTVGFIHPSWAPQRDSFILTSVLGLAGLWTIRVAVVQVLRW